MSSISDLNNVRRQSGYFGLARQTRDLLLVEDGAELSSGNTIITADTNLNTEISTFHESGAHFSTHPGPAIAKQSREVGHLADQCFLEA